MDAVSDNNLRLLVDNIVINEIDGKLSINIDLKATFCSHLDIYDEDGTLTAEAFAANGAVGRRTATSYASLEDRVTTERE